MSKENMMTNIFNEKLNYQEPPAPEIDPKEFIKVVQSRRSVRKFAQEPIPDEIVEQCLDLALLAPSSSNLQPWEFYWIQNPNIREKLNQAFLSQPASVTAPTLIIAIARTKTWAKNSRQMLLVFDKQNHKVSRSVIQYYSKIVYLFYITGFLNCVGFIKKLTFSVIGLFTPTPREVTSKSQLKIWAVKSTALACENLMLSFRAFGYDTCPMEGMDSKRIKKILKLPCDAEVVMGISAGKRTPEGIYGPRIRFDRHQFIKKI